MKNETAADVVNMIQERIKNDIKYRIFRSPINKTLFCICKTDKYENPIEVLESDISFEIASEKIEQYQAKF